MKLSKRMVLLLAFTVAVFGTSCSGGGGGAGGGGQGTLNLGLIDASTHDFRAVFVTIDAVEVHLGGNENNPNRWRQTAMPVSPLTVNLLDLVNGVREDLGLVNLTAHRYTQMRLIIGKNPGPGIHPFANYVITNTNPVEVHELKIPSGTKTGFKIVNGFTIFAGQTTELLLDFDACRSVVRAGNSGQWLLKPTVKVLDTAEYAIVKGRVVDDGIVPAGINGAVVSMQKYDASATDEKDVVSVVATTITDSIEVTPGNIEDGYFTLFVAPLLTGESYNLVVYKDGMLPDFMKITSLGMGETRILGDTQLSAATATGNVNGLVTINGVNPAEAYATLSFRQEAAFPGPTNEEIEIVTLNVLTGHTYNVQLPENNYHLVASTFFGFATETYSPVNVSAVAPLILDIDFTTPQL